MTAEFTVASFPPPIDRNPYQRLLYEHLHAQGIVLDRAPHLDVGWLWRNRGRVRTLHFHWPEWYYRHDSSRRLVRALSSRLRFGLFAGRLTVARMLGYRVVWTVHQTRPHESSSRAIDSAAAILLARVSDVLIVLDRATGDALVRDVPAAAGKLHVVPHGSYSGVYANGRSRVEMRAALGIEADAFVALSFGQIRTYKSIDLLVEGFRHAAIPGAVLLVAGLPLHEQEARRVADEAGRDRTVVALLDYVPDEGVAELFEASDVVVSARGDGGTSGSLVLALTLGLPVVAAATPANEELTGRGRAAWYFAPESASSLSDALRDAATDPTIRAEKARSAAELASAMSWEEIARETARLLRGR